MVTALAGALIGGGLAVAAVGARGVPSTLARETSPRQKEDRPRHRSRLAQAGMAVAVAVVVLAATGWPVAAVLAACAAAGLPTLSGERRRRVDQRAVVEAIAAWTEMLRDAVASGRGVQEAVALTAPLAPAALRDATLSLRARSVRGPLAPALRAFADEVGDPMADLVAATLTLAATREVRELADLLGALARTTRQRAALRLAAEAGRAGMRTTARSIAGMTIVLLVGMMVLQPAYLSPYATPIGQVVALAAAGWFALGFWGLSRLGRPTTPRRLHLREVAP